MKLSALECKLRHRSPPLHQTLQMKIRVKVGHGLGEREREGDGFRNKSELKFLLYIDKKNKYNYGSPLLVGN